MSRAKKNRFGIKTKILKHSLSCKSFSSMPVMVQAMDCGWKSSSNSSCAITFTFGQIRLERYQFGYPYSKSLAIVPILRYLISESLRH